MKFFKFRGGGGQWYEGIYINFQNYGGESIPPLYATLLNTFIQSTYILHTIVCTYVYIHSACNLYKYERKGLL